MPSLLSVWAALPVCTMPELFYAKAAWSAGGEPSTQIGGAILGGLLSIALGIGNGIDDFDIGTIFLAVVGAMLLLGAYRLVARNA